MCPRSRLPTHPPLMELHDEQGAVFQWKEKPKWFKVCSTLGWRSGVLHAIPALLQQNVLLS